MIRYLQKVRWSGGGKVNWLLAIRRFVSCMLICRVNKETGLALLLECTFTPLCVKGLSFIDHGLKFISVYKTQLCDNAWGIPPYVIWMAGLNGMYSDLLILGRFHCRQQIYIFNIHAKTQINYISLCLCTQIKCSSKLYICINNNNNACLFRILFKDALIKDG